MMKPMIMKILSRVNSDYSYGRFVFFEEITRGFIAIEDIATISEIQDIAIIASRIRNKSNIRYN